MTGANAARSEVFELAAGVTLALTVLDGDYDAALDLGREVPDEHLVHPYLSYPAALANRWQGRDSLHAGGVVVDGRVWGLCGSATSGKTTTLAWLLREGCTITTDDLLVLADGLAYTGPRCLDLREETAVHLGLGDDLGGIVGSRRRWRARLGDAEAAYPLAGLIHLAWGEELDVTTVPAADRLRALFANDALQQGPVDPANFLRLAALPAFTFTRPPGLDGLDQAGHRLLEVLRERPGPG